jgi:lysozyme family protein
MFSDFLPILKRSEGGYANVKADRGGETYAGITRKNYPTWAGWSIVDAVKPKQNQIIVNPKLDILIADFYKKNFWDLLQCDKFSKYVGMNLCDFAVGSGTVTAARAFQKVINSLMATGQTTLVVDGKIGPATITAANKLNQQKLNDALLDYRRKFYQTIVANNPTQAQFLRSWTNRLVNFQFIEEIKKKVNVNYVLIGGVILALLLIVKYKK